LQQRQQAWEQKQAETAKFVAQMEQRCRTLEKAEEAAKRRLAELDDLEERLREEFETQERQLAQERRELETLRNQLRPRILPRPDRSARAGS
jgi:hypothetical protein